MEVEDEEEQELAISKIDFHENYNVGPEYNNDIAVVHIHRAKHPHGIRFGDKVVPVCLPQVNYVIGGTKFQTQIFLSTIFNIFCCPGDGGLLGPRQRDGVRLGLAGAGHRGLQGRAGQLRVAGALGYCYLMITINAEL